MYTDSFGRQHRYAPPAGYEAPKSFSFNAETDWQRIVARGLHFEPYYSGPTAVASVCGDCLHPLLIEGQHSLLIRPFAADEALVDGDLYVIEWPDNEGEPNLHRDENGRILIAKFVRYIGNIAGQWYVQWNDAIAPLKGEVIAKVVGVTTSTVKLGKIAANAVTESYDAVDSFGPTATAGTTSSSAGSFTLPALAADCTIKARVEYEAHSSATGGASDNAYYSVGGVQTPLTNQIRQNWFTSSGDLSASQVTNVSSLSFTAGQVVTFGVTSTANAGSGSNTIKNIRYQILVLKK